MIAHSKILRRDLRLLVVSLSPENINLALMVRSVLTYTAQVTPIAEMALIFNKLLCNRGQKIYKVSQLSFLSDGRRFQETFWLQVSGMR